MYIGALLILLAAFAFASAGLYYVAAILVLFGKLLGALVVGIVGGCRLFAKGAWLALLGLAWIVSRLAGIAWELAHRAAQEGDAATASAHRAGMVAVEWLKRTYVKREKRERGL
ncbi:BcepNY3gp69 [Burkholderia phage BcepNY3]|uniref:BcepNY3gp69 n=1 Tax=Burkholderia phage BcepNY3 TaxID=2881397 RepID=A6N3H7_9CAUD|nr:membrane protein [Burkholderia phage BcepNY3]ABR10604.1 BcepNY3gp69 [Burkholderia phage BcepNY3]